jgi:hypothetical protein
MLCSVVVRVLYCCCECGVNCVVREQGGDYAWGGGGGGGGGGRVGGERRIEEIRSC